MHVEGELVLPSTCCAGASGLEAAFADRLLCSFLLKSVTVKSECVFKTSSNWVLHYLHPGRTGGIGRYFSPVRVQIFATPTTSSRVVSGTEMRPKMGLFSEPLAIVLILEGSRNGPGFRAHFLSRFSPF